MSAASHFTAQYGMTFRYDISGFGRSAGVDLYVSHIAVNGGAARHIMPSIWTMRQNCHFVRCSAGRDARLKPL